VPALDQREAGRAAHDRPRQRRRALPATHTLELSLPFDRHPYLGLPLVDDANLDELAQLAAARNCWTFLLVSAPSRTTGATSSRVNPLAIF
jgi:hypothetical protein